MKYTEDLKVVFPKHIVKKKKHRGILIKSGNHFPEDEKELCKPKSAFRNSFDPLALLRGGN